MKHGTCIPMTDHQRAELRAFITKHLEDEKVARDFDQPATPIVAIRPWLCEKIPGLLRVVTTHDITLTALYPEPRPLPGDPLFQHAEPIQCAHQLAFLRCLNGTLAWMRDWQWAFSMLDAPDEMPAGACYGFDHGDDVYGASQMTVGRE